MVPSTDVPAQEVLKELERVLSSPGFVRNERLSRFLRLAVERSLEGKSAELKESVLGVEVFGRSPGFDPKRDPVVRTEAARLRARLAVYYATANDGGLVITLPKGGYVPELRKTVRAAQADASTLLTLPKTSSSSLRWRIGLALTAAVLCAAGWRWVAAPNAPIPIAVLPLRNLSPDGAGDFFVDGLTGEIIRNLSIIDGLAVRSQTSSFAFKGRPPNVREAGTRLAADYILEGSVLRSDGQLRINVQLVRVADDLPVWSERYDRVSTDVFAIQDEISRGIVNSLRLKLGQGRRRYETSVEGYDLYLRARALQIREVFGDENSIGFFEEAIAKDHSLAPAYAGLAAAYAERSEQSSDPALIRQDLVRMRETSEKAIQLDPLLAEAHEARGMSCARDGQWEQSEKSFRRALALDPNNSTSRSHFACNLLLPLGRVAEAVRELRVAESGDPLSAGVHFRLGYILVSAGNYDAAASQCEMMVSDSKKKSQCLGRARLFQGRTEEAIGILAAQENWGYLGYAYSRAGRREEAEKLVASFPRAPFPSTFVFAGLGDKARTLEALELVAAQGPVRLGRILTFPEFALIRGDLRLAALRKKVGLPGTL